MCLILLAWQAHPRYPLLVAANRDEFFARATAPAHFWQDAPDILAGRDLTAGGTWMGVTRHGRFAALTNFREPGHHQVDAPSRGALVSEFLGGAMPPDDYLDKLSSTTAHYNGFNLLCGTTDGGLCYFSNRGASPHAMRLAPGIVGLSNDLLDTPWPKVAQGKSDLAAALAALPSDTPLFKLLRDNRIHDDDQLPRTGVSLEWERVLSAAFVEADNYGTRSSTVVLQNSEGVILFDEQTYVRGGVASQRNRFRFRTEGTASS